MIDAASRVFCWSTELVQEPKQKQIFRKNRPQRKSLINFLDILEFDSKSLYPFKFSGILVSILILSPSVWSTWTGIGL